MEVFVARQPIFDGHDQVAGYELLYRRGQASSSAAGLHTLDMSSNVIVDTFLGIGLQRMTGGRPAFINCTRELLLSGTIELLDPRQIVLEVLEDVEPSPEVVAACRRLVACGYRLALDDFIYDDRWEPLLALAEMVKVEVLDAPEAELAALVERLRPFGVALIAEKVETREAREACKRVGFDYFQGYFFSRPETLSRRDLSVREIGVLRLLNLLRDLDSPDAQLEDAFRSDVSLSYKLLRMANAAAIGCSGIHSLGHAIRLLGREPLYRWLALLLIAGKNGGTDTELLQTALVRARLCERIAESAGRRAAAGSLFLVGLFSLLDALLGNDMEEVLSHLVLTDAVAEALLHRTGAFAPTLELVEAYEAGRWDEVAERARGVGVALESLPPLYLEALAWSRSRLAGEEP